MKVKPIEFKNDVLYLIDQRLIPYKEEYVEVRTLKECYESINLMVTRGAPIIGFTTIYGMALWAKNNPDYNLKSLEDAVSYIKKARPTAVNLAYEADRCFEILKNTQDKSQAYSTLVSFGNEEIKKLENDNTQMAKFALEDLKKRLGKDRFRLLTHCNTRRLACGCIGTALGVVSYLHTNNHVEHVYADETRPYLQGSRLTAFELSKENIPHEIVVEGAASYLMRNKLVDAIFVGADRIVKNGDTANKIGTSNLAIIADYYKVPFYVVAPTSSFDLSLSSGSDIEIELRSEEEIKQYRGLEIAPKKSRALNPSFDVTDSHLITGIICEKKLITDHASQGVSW